MKPTRRRRRVLDGSRLQTFSEVVMLDFVSIVMLGVCAFLVLLLMAVHRGKRIRDDVEDVRKSRDVDEWILGCKDAVDKSQKSGG